MSEAAGDASGGVITRRQASRYPQKDKSAAKRRLAPKSDAESPEDVELASDSDGGVPRTPVAAARGRAQSQITRDQLDALEQRFERRSQSIEQHMLERVDAMQNDLSRAVADTQELVRQLGQRVSQGLGSVQDSQTKLAKDFEAIQRALADMQSRFARQGGSGWRDSRAEGAGPQSGHRGGRGEQRPIDEARGLAIPALATATRSSGDASGSAATPQHAQGHVAGVVDLVEGADPAVDARTQRAADADVQNETHGGFVTVAGRKRQQRRRVEQETAGVSSDWDGDAMRFVQELEQMGASLKKKWHVFDASQHGGEPRHVNGRAANVIRISVAPVYRAARALKSVLGDLRASHVIHIARPTCSTEAEVKVFVTLCESPSRAGQAGLVALATKLAASARWVGAALREQMSDSESKVTAILSMRDELVAAQVSSGERVLVSETREVHVKGGIVVAFLGGLDIECKRCPAPEAFLGRVVRGRIMAELYGKMQDANEDEIAALLALIADLGDERHVQPEEVTPLMQSILARMIKSYHRVAIGEIEDGGTHVTAHECVGGEGKMRWVIYDSQQKSWSVRIRWEGPQREGKEENRGGGSRAGASSDATGGHGVPGAPSTGGDAARGPSEEAIIAAVRELENRIAAEEGKRGAGGASATDRAAIGAGDAGDVRRAIEEVDLVDLAAVVSQSETSVAVDSAQPPTWKGASGSDQRPASRTPVVQESFEVVVVPAPLYGRDASGMGNGDRLGDALASLLEALQPQSQARLKSIGMKGVSSAARVAAHVAAGVRAGDTAMLREVVKASAAEQTAFMHLPHASDEEMESIEAAVAGVTESTIKRAWMMVHAGRVLPELSKSEEVYITMHAPLMLQQLQRLSVEAGAAAGEVRVRSVVISSVRGLMKVWAGRDFLGVMGELAVPAALEIARVILGVAIRKMVKDIRFSCERVGVSGRAAMQGMLRAAMEEAPEELAARFQSGELILRVSEEEAMGPLSQVPLRRRS